MNSALKRSPSESRHRIREYALRIAEFARDAHEADPAASGLLRFRERWATVGMGDPVGPERVREILVSVAADPAAALDAVPPYPEIPAG